MVLSLYLQSYKLYHNWKCIGTPKKEAEWNNIIKYEEKPVLWGEGEEY